MKVDKRETLDVTLEGYEEINAFRSMIHKVSDSAHTIGFKQEGLTKREKDLVDNIKEQTDE